MNNKSKIIIEILSLVIVILLAVFGYKFFIKSKNEIEINSNNNQKLSVGNNFGVKMPVDSFVVENQEVQLYKDEKVDISKPEKLPPAAKFKIFTYDAKVGKIINISGTCSDIYYAVLIFSANDDYKTNPAAAKINRAEECPQNRQFKTEFNLKDYNLLSGEYYFFAADQGKTGTWYNPR